MRKLVMAAAAVLCAANAANAVDVSFEETLAHEEEARILTSPIAGIENSLWFDYQIDITEARKELASDLRRVSDVEDLREAWEEYALELRGEREDYVKEMAEKGYRGMVTITD